MKKQIIAAILLFISVIAVIKILVLKDLPLVRIGHLMLHFGGTQEGKANLIPFKTIIPYLLGAKGLLIGGINIIGNIVLFIPIGLLISVVFEKLNTTKMVMIAIAIGLIIESTQAILHIGIFDIDDVILNGLGVYLGYAFLQLYNQLITTKWKNLVAFLIGFPLIVIVFYLLVYYRNNHSFPISISQAPSIMVMDDNSSKHATNECCDLCGGTGGIGKVIKIASSTFDIERKDGIVIHVKLSSKGIVKSNAGTIHLSNVKVGNPVTLVGDAKQDNSFIADLVLVCQMTSDTSSLPTHNQIK